MAENRELALVRPRQRIKNSLRIRPVRHRVLFYSLSK